MWPLFFFPLIEYQTMYQLTDQNDCFISPASADECLLDALATYIPASTVCQVDQPEQFLNYDGTIAEPSAERLTAAWIVCKVGLSAANGVSRLRNELAREAAILTYPVNVISYPCTVLTAVFPNRERKVIGFALSPLVSAQLVSEYLKQTSFYPVPGTRVELARCEHGLDRQIFVAELTRSAKAVWVI